MGTGLAGFLVVAFASPLFVTRRTQGGGGMMGGSGMMGNLVGMMTWWFPGNGAYSYPSGLWLLPVALLLLMVIGIIIVGYQAILPEIKSSPAPATPESAARPVSLQANQAPAASLEAVLRTLRPDERKVFDVLLTHDGRYLQKLLKSETGLSRLQVHRVVSRLVERNLITMKAVGNTNEISIAGWALGDKKEP